MNDNFASWFFILVAVIFVHQTSSATPSMQCDTLVAGQQYLCELVDPGNAMTETWQAIRPSEATISATGSQWRRLYTCTDFEASYNVQTEEWIPYSRTFTAKINYAIVPNFQPTLSKEKHGLKCDSKPAPTDVDPPMVAQAPNVTGVFQFCGEPNGTAWWELTMSAAQGTAEDFFIEQTYNNGSSWTQIYDGDQSQIDCPGDSLDLRIRVMISGAIVPSEYRYLTLFRNCPSGSGPGDNGINKFSDGAFSPIGELPNPNPFGGTVPIGGVAPPTPQGP